MGLLAAGEGTREPCHDGRPSHQGGRARQGLRLPAQNEHLVGTHRIRAELDCRAEPWSLQVAASKAAGCGMVRIEQQSGTNPDRRPELKSILDPIHSGGTPAVVHADRPPRNLGDRQAIVSQSKARGAHLAATGQPVDKARVAGKAFLDMFGVLVEFKADLRRERRAEDVADGKRRASTVVAHQDRYGRDAGRAYGTPSPTGIAQDMRIARHTVHEPGSPMPSDDETSKQAAA